MRRIFGNYWPSGHTLGGFLAGLRAAKNYIPPEPAMRKPCGWFDVTSINLPLGRLPPAFDGYRIAQLSDIHMDGRMTAEKLANVVRAINIEEPDFIAITGDFVTHSPRKFAPHLIDTLRNLKSADGGAAVLGNHDRWSGPGEVHDIIRQSGLQPLGEKFLSLRREADVLHIAGLDNPTRMNNRLPAQLEQIPPGEPAILLAHEPDPADFTAQTGRFDLQLSGHSHGGQISLPLVGPPFLPGYAHKYPRGLYCIQQMLLYTTHGLGAVHLPWRVNSRPEVVLITLRAAHNGRVSTR